MDLNRPTFWLDRLVLLATTYTIIAYILSPSSNKCQMTFMMEPPTFVPVPIESLQSDKTAERLKSNPDSNFNKYKLYMYSEIGFPQLTNVQKDFDDSMPVLFIPGNAGSYQQVRSLASTSLRNQLQSLDSYKFIFYTIHFNQELSGLSGRLINEETRFVNLALKQIAKLHPVDTGGIIVIGHSVGGFISKNLYTLPDFDAHSVPLLISLASPLKQPHLSFDDEMVEAYKKANLVWEKRVAGRNNTISISISGGKTDKLVPMHLSMDPTYDLSLTTSAIKEVWLATDHLCITWCRELMHKLSSLLSSLMYKKQTHLIKDKTEALSIIRNKLLTHDKPHDKGNKEVITTKLWRSSKPYQTVEFNTFHQLTRIQLSDHIVILKTDKLLGTDLLITIDHLNEITPGKVFKCYDLQVSSDDSELNCSRRLELADFSYPVPTLRFEPRRAAIKTDLGRHESDETIVFDFYTRADKNYDLSSKLPELVTIQEMHQEHEETLYIPTLFELIINKVLFMEPYRYDIAGSVRESNVFSRYRLINLIDESQVISIELESSNCKDEYPNHSVIMLYQGEHLSQSYHPKETFHKNSDSKKDVAFRFNIQPNQAVIIKNEFTNESYYLDFYMDGTCENRITLSPDLVALAILCIHRNLARVLALGSYLVFVSIVNGALYHQHSKRSSLISGLFNVLGFLLLYFWDEYPSSSSMADQTAFFITITVLSFGIVALMRHLFHRIVNVMTILNNLQSFLKKHLLALEPAGRCCEIDSDVVSATTHNKTETRKYVKIEWILVTATIFSSVILSVAFTSLVQLLFVIKTNFVLSWTQEKSPACKEKNKHISREAQQLEAEALTRKAETGKLTASLGVFCGLAFVSSIPEALLRIRSSKMDLLHSTLDLRTYQELPFVLSFVSLILVKIICDRLLDTQSSPSKKPMNTLIKSGLQLTRRLGYLLVLAPLLQVETNLAYLRMALTSTLVWLYLLFVAGRQQ